MISVKITSENDIYQAVALASYLMKGHSFDVSDQQSIIISILEVTRNVLEHAGGQGLFRCEMISEGFRFICRDNGQGISNVDDVLHGISESSQGLGIGLASVKRLMDELYIDTSERGTEIVAVKRRRRR